MHLDELLTLPPQDQARKLELLAGTDPELSSHLREILQSRETGSFELFLDGVATESLLGPMVAAGEVLGAWTLVDVMGQGGMGSVWRARRSDGRFEGEAAIKLLHGGHFDRVTQERFRREGALLAKLRHPGIAQLLDAGISPRGQPYLVLELVHGERIDHWCAIRNLGVRERVTLFRQVLDAVAAAHSQFVIHRDIKPSNILINESGQVKLLDFGIAQLVGDDAAPGLTREGAMALTPEYAAPEQFKGVALTMATDVYGLGVVLYELLTGTHPSGLAQGGPLDYMRFATEGGRVRASERTSSLRKSLRGDLDNILLKALRPNAGERYGSVSGFADDLQRYLTLMPIAARPDSRVYRFGKLVRRRKLAVAGASLLSFTIAAGAIGTVVESRRAEQESAVARAERAKALEASTESAVQRSIAEQQSESANQAAQQAAHSAAIAQAAAASAEKERERAKKMLARSVNAEYFNNDLLMHTANAGRSLDFKALLAKGEFLATRENSNPLYQATALLTLVEFYNSTGDGAKATELASRAIKSAQAANDESLALHAHCALGRAMVIEEKIEEGRAEIEKSLRFAKEDAQVQTYCWESLADVAMRLREGPRMLEYANHALAASKAIPVQSPPQTASLLTSLADAHRLLNNNSEAEQNYSSAFDALNRAGISEGWEAADLLTNWAAFTSGTGQHLRGLALTEKAISIASGNVGPENLHPSLLLTHCRILTALNQLDEAWAATARAQDRAKQVGNRQVQALTEQSFSQINVLQGRYAEAWQHADKFGELLGAVPPNSLPALAVQFSRARIHQAQGSYTEALATLDGIRQQLDALSAKKGRRQGVLPKVWQNWLEMHADLLGKIGRTQAAIDEAQEAISFARSLQSAQTASADTGTSLLVLAQLQLAASDKASATATASDAVSMLERSLGPNHPKTVTARELIRGVTTSTLH
jgi:hypothetical protein